MTTRRGSLAVLPLALLLAGCGERAPVAAGPRPPEGWTEVGEAALTPAQKGQRDKALAARDALAKRVMGKLEEAMLGGGPAAAVAVCKGEATRLTEEVGKEQGVAIGRTSFGLRNPANGGPPWAGPYVAARVDRPTFLAAGDGRLAALLPIRMKPLCVVCHGPVDHLKPDVKTALEKAYPHDAGTGFKNGDLRGWFWVEVPKP